MIVFVRFSIYTLELIEAFLDLTNEFHGFVKRAKIDYDGFDTIRKIINRVIVAECIDGENKSDKTGGTRIEEGGDSGGTGAGVV